MVRISPTCTQVYQRTIPTSILFTGSVSVGKVSDGPHLQSFDNDWMWLKHIQSY